LRGVAVCRCGVSLHRASCCMSCWVCHPCAVHHTVCCCGVSSSHSVLHGRCHYGAVYCCRCTMLLWHCVLLLLCHVPLSSHCVLWSCHVIAPLWHHIIVVALLRCDTGPGKPMVFGSRFSRFRVRVEPEQTCTPSQPLPMVYGFFMGH